MKIYTHMGHLKGRPTQMHENTFYVLPLVPSHEESLICAGFEISVFAIFYTMEVNGVP